MSIAPSAEYLTSLVLELCHQVGEVGRVEFKRSKVDLQEISEYISALSKAAALNGKAHGYVLWGIDLESWLLRLLKEAVDDGKIAINGASAERRHRTYLLFWTGLDAEEVFQSI